MLRKCALSALGRNHATQGMSLACLRGGQRRKIAFTRSLRNSLSPLHMPTPLPQRWRRTNARRLRRSPKRIARNRYRTSVEQHSTLCTASEQQTPNERIAVVELARELNRHSASATHEQTHLAEHPGQLVWIFMGMSVVGLMGETPVSYTHLTLPTKLEV